MYFLDGVNGMLCLIINKLCFEIEVMLSYFLMFCLLVSYFMGEFFGVNEWLYVGDWSI